MDKLGLFVLGLSSLGLFSLGLFLWRHIDDGPTISDHAELIDWYPGSSMKSMWKEVERLAGLAQHKQVGLKY